MKWTLLSVGKLKTRGLREVAADYTARIQKYHGSFSVVEVPDQAVLPKAEVKPVLEKEAVKFKKYLKPGSWVIVLDEKGKQFTSSALADEIQKWLLSAPREIVWIIGGAHGIAEGIKARANLTWSLSKLTLPHQLARVVALEQIYRALTILKNVPYHNV